MERTTDLANMPAPGVGSGKEACDTMLKGSAVYASSSEKGSNDLTEYVTPKLPTGGASGRNKF